MVNQTLRSLVYVVMGKNYKTWEDYLPQIEFSDNRSIHSSTSYSQFEIVYGFNTLTPLNLYPLPVNEILNIDGQQRLQVVKIIYEKVRQQIEEKNKKYA